MDQLQAQLADLVAQKDKLFEDGNADQVLVSRLNEQIKAVQAQITQITVQQAEASQMEQEKEEKLEGLAQLISDYDIFGALFPVDGYQEILGLNSYNEKRQSLNQILHAFATGIQSDTIDEYNGKLAAANEQLRVQTGRADDAEGQLAEEQAKSTQAVAQFTAQLSQKDTEIASLNDQLQLKQEHIDQLRTDLVNAPAPTSTAIDITPKANQSFTDLINATRTQSARSVKTAQQLALEGTQFRGKVILGSTGAPIATVDGGSESTDSFRDEAAQTDAQDSGVLDTGAITPPPFQSEVPGEGAEVGGDTVIPALVGETASVESRLAALERAVFGEVKGAAA